MTINAVPNLIEQDDLTAGWMPDLDAATVPPNALLDVLNLLPEPSLRRSSNTPQGLVTRVAGGSLVTRSGFSRLQSAIVGDGTHYIRQIWHAGGAGAGARLILLLTDETTAANNVQLWTIRLRDLATTRMDTAGHIWADSKAHHWGIWVGNKWYGGTVTDTFYSWTPSGGGTWTADAGAPNAKAWVQTNDINDTVTEVAHDYAWRGNELVSYNGSHYHVVGVNRFQGWDDDSGYKPGQKVSHTCDGANGTSYKKSFRCIASNDSSDSDTEPGMGANWRDFWQKISFDYPVDPDDGEVTDDWQFVPKAASGKIGTWHQNRMWIRYDNADDGQLDRLQFSAPLQLTHGDDIASAVFDPTNFAPGDDATGAGGGWLSFTDGRGHSAITALQSYGQYLMVFKREKVFVLSGFDETEFNIRLLDSSVGAVGPHAATEHDGIVYFLADDGLYMTDGTTVDPCPGMEMLRETIKTRLNSHWAATDTQEPRVVSYNQYIFISLPVTGDNEPYLTLVYHPETQSFWKTHLPVVDMVVASKDGGKQVMWFTAPKAYGKDLVYQYAAATTDDTGATSPATAAVSWYLRSAWFSFGVARWQRRIRRTWALVKGALTYTLYTYRDYDDTNVASVARTVADTTPVHIEGEWVPDSHAISYKLSGSSPVTIYGLAADTEPRRPRYHTG